MIKLDVDLGDRSYPIYIGAGLLDRLSDLLTTLPQKRAVVVTNTTVAPLYLARVRVSLERAGIGVDAIEIPDGEAYKNLATLESILTTLLERRAERATAVVALGGGVVGDIAGFAAAIYQRGVPFVQLPTTLLAQVDSSVGGKTAINHPLGKNMIGAFYQPRAVVVDTATLATLPDRELSAGLAEVVKYGLISDLQFLEWLENRVGDLRRRDANALSEAIAWSCRIKASVVGRDERESGERALLNLGHTFGHAIEARLGYGEWLHGEAVGAGMILAARLSQALGELSAADVERVVVLIGKAGLPVAPPSIPADTFIDLMSRDKKVAGGEIRFVLLRRLGEAYVGKVAMSTLRSVLTAPA